MSQLLLVYGATGAQGGAVVRAARAAGYRVRALVRRALPHPFPDAPDVELAIGDFDDPESLQRASDGVTGVALVLPLVYEEERVIAWGRAAIDAAIAGGASQIVFNTSAPTPEARAGVAAVDIKVALTGYLRAAPIASVTLRPTVYLGNLLGPWTLPGIVEHGVFAYPYPPSQPVAWISWEDVAAYTLAAFARPEVAATRPSLRIGGPEALTGPQLAAAIAPAVGHAVRFEEIPLPGFEAGLANAIGPDAAQAIVAFYHWLHTSDEGHRSTHGLEEGQRLLPIRQTTAAEWARTVAWQSPS